MGRYVSITCIEYTLIHFVETIKKGISLDGELIMGLPICKNLNLKLKENKMGQIIVSMYLSLMVSWRNQLGLLHTSMKK